MYFYKRIIFSRYFALYEEESPNKWLNLTTYLTSNSISKLNPTVGIIRPFGELTSDPKFDRSSYSSGATTSKLKREKLDFLQLEDINLPYLQSVPETVPNLMNIPDRCPPNCAPSDITRHHMDCILAVDQLFCTAPCQEHLIAEIQYSFAIFLIGHSIEGLMHWRKILLLLANSISALEKYSEFYERYFDALKFQLLELPEELMNPNERNMVYRDVRQLVINGLECLRLNDVLNRFLEFLRSNMKWFLNDEFKEEDPDDMPVIVEFEKLHINID